MFLEDNAALPPAYRVKVEKCASFVHVLDVCKFTFCDRKGYTRACMEGPAGAGRALSACACACVKYVRARRKD